MNLRRDWIRGVAVVMLLMLGFAVKGLLIEPPSPPPTVAAGEFNTQRAIARLQRILGDERPHPVDTAADDAVRERLLRELRAIGLQPEVREADDCSDSPERRLVSCSHVHNVVVTVAGREPGQHLLLNAHYDSTPTGPGASDDGVGVATLLEVASILKDSPPPRPVTFLFNEGEEFGLNGSSAFVRSDPVAPHVNSLINIDTRGVAGPALMFETSDPNRAALSIYARGARRPYANSLGSDFAKLIPNTTDVVEFKPSGWTILNLAIVGNESRYHSPGDTIAALNRASLYHVGSEVLALTRTMGSTAEPGRIASGQTVFTDFAGRAFIHLPLVIAAGLLALLFLAALVLAWRERVFGRALLVAAGATLAGISTSSIVTIAASALRPGDFWRAFPSFTYLAAYAVLLSAMTAFLIRWGPRADRGSLRAATWLLILLIGSVLSIALPGAMIFFLIAPAAALTGIVLQHRSPRLATGFLIGAAIIQYLMFAQMLALIEMLLIDGPLWAVTPLAALAALPFLVEIAGAPLRPSLVLLLAASLGLWTCAIVLPRSSYERPASFSIDYFRDADHKNAFWGIASKQAPLPAGYPGQWRKGILPYNGRSRWIAAAPALATPEPSVRVMGSQPAGAGRRVRLVLSPGGTEAVSISFAATTKLLEVGVPGALKKIQTTTDHKKEIVRCSGRSCAGFVIEAVFADRAPVQASMFAVRFGLPPEGKSLEAARPKNAIPQYAPDSTITLARVKF